MVVLLRLVTLALAQAVDFATFTAMVARRGPSAEANPLVSGLFGEMGMPAVAVAKIAIVILVAALVLAGTARGGRGVWALIAGVPLAIAIAAGLVGAITNAASYLG